MGRFRVIVDRDICQGHSVCKNEAPEIFRVVDDGSAPYPKVELITELPAPELLDKAETAADLCPNGVIRIERLDD